MKKPLVLILAGLILTSLAVFASGSDEPATEPASAAAEVSPTMPKLDPGQYNLADYEAQTGRKITTFQESPMLAGSGLPPVQDRLPQNPLVMETWEANGRYGGTLTWIEHTPDFDEYLRRLNDALLIEIKPGRSHHRWSYIGAELQPSVLESWEMSPDRRTFTMTIRKGLRWSDGVEVTSEDIRYTVEDIRLNKELSPSQPRFFVFGGGVTDFEVVDKYTSHLTFANPFGLFPWHCTRLSWHDMIRPSHYLKQFHTAYTDIDEIFPTMEKMGFKKDEWARFYQTIDLMDGDAGTRIPTRYPTMFEFPTLDPWLNVAQPTPGEFLLERNPYYFKVDSEGRQLPYIDKLHRVIVTNPEVTAAKVIAGETDIQYNHLKMSDFPLFKANEEKGGYKALLLPAWQDLVLMYFPYLTPIKDPVIMELMGDKRFRQAVSLAIDRNEIKKSVFLDFGRIAQFAPPKGSAAWEEYMEKAYAEHDVAEANRLLDEIGLQWDDKQEYRLRPDGKRLTIPYLYYEVASASTPGAELFAEFMKEIGIDCPVKLVDGSLYWTSNKSGEPHFGGGFSIAAQEMTFWTAMARVTAFFWETWYNTGGEKGEQPPPEFRELYDLKKIIVANTSEAEFQEAVKQAWESQAENVWIIGTVADVPAPLVFNKNLGNIAIIEELGWPNIIAGEFAEQWYWKQ